MSGSDPLTLPGLPKDMDGPVFAEPWQAQAFALAIQLHDQGAFTWAEWADSLSRQLKAAGPEDDGSRYYEHWLSALEKLTNDKRLTDAEALDARKRAWTEAYRRTPHGKPVTL